MHGATRFGSRRNSQTSSVDAGTVNSFSRWIAIGYLLLTGLELREASGAAEPVRLAAQVEAVPAGGGVDRHPADRVDRLLADGRGGHHRWPLEAAGRPELDQLGQDGHRDLLMGNVAQVEARRPVEPVEG